MSREILFRGVLPKCKEWVYGGYFKAEYCDGKGLQNFIKITGAGFVPVLPETVGQFTGRQDKNKVKIFEHDKFQVANSIIYEVVYCDNENSGVR